MFAHLSDEGGEAVQANQTEILASNADPDIIASLNRWMTST